MVDENGTDRTSSVATAGKDGGICDERDVPVVARSAAQLEATRRTAIKLTHLWFMLPTQVFDFMSSSFRLVAG